MTQTVKKVPLYRYYQGGNRSQWASEMEEMIRAYVRGEEVFIEFNGDSDSRRTGSIAKLSITHDEMQNILYGSYDNTRWGYRNNPPREVIAVTEQGIKASNLQYYQPSFVAKWTGRRNALDVNNGYGANWLKGYDATQGTKWVWAKPEDPPAVIPKDKLGRDITKGDFISYILYHFDNSHNAAGIYYGKVTKIEGDGTVHARNIKLSEDDQVAEKRIKDNSLIVIMSKDLMDKLMMARLSIL